MYNLQFFKLCRNNSHMPADIDERERVSPIISLSAIAVTRWLICIVAGIHILNAVAVWLQYEAGALPHKYLFIKIFQVGSEGKFPTWYSACTLLFCSLLLMVIAYAKRGTKNEYLFHWIGLAVIFALMSLDEAAALHELSSSFIRHQLNISEDSPWGWEIAGLVLLLIFGVFYYRFVLALPGRSMYLFIAAGCTYVIGVIGVEMVGGTYEARYGTDLRYGIIASIEEVFEMTGIVLFIYSLLDYLEKQFGSLRISFDPG